MDIFIDEIPGGALPSMEIVIGATITHFNPLHQFETFVVKAEDPHMSRSKEIFFPYFTPNLMIPTPCKVKMRELIDRLKIEAPRATEIRILLWTGLGSNEPLAFICAVTLP